MPGLVLPPCAPPAEPELPPDPAVEPPVPAPEEPVPDELEPVPDIEANRTQYRIVGWDLEPGDAIAFNFLTLHSAPGNASVGRARRAFSLRLVGDDATFARRKGTTSPPFRDVTLPHGAPLDGPEFPLVLPR